ncbi:hypothetical protein A2U01_0086632, partial [Trifolium medium]|nr:hypothetical protein [Trifolium medium]
KKEKAFKKPRSVKKRVPRIQKKNVVNQPLRKRTEQADPEKAQPASEDMETDADTGISKSPNNKVPIFQAQTSPISSSLNQPLLE